MAATKPQTQQLTPETIKRVRFAQVRRGGYDTQEVDLFLHRLLEVVENSPSLFPETDQISSSEDLHDPEGAAQRLLSAAQRTADSVINDAREQAEHLLASAEAQSDNMKRLVTEEARQMAEESQMELKKVLSALAVEKTRLQGRCDYLEGQLQAGKDQLLATVDELRLTIEEGDLSLGLSDEERSEFSQEDEFEIVAVVKETTSSELKEIETDGESKDQEGISEELLSVGELMDSPPELSLVHDKEANKVWLQEASMEAEEGLAEIEINEEWDQGPETEAIQVIDGREIVSGDRFFEELSDSDPHVSSLGEVDDSTDAAIDAFLGKEID
ncbi:MAG TPA: DivIVA domain-containing protein [Acidimicrobiales bacterium]|nr:DivIVA domain-containing protein [Acidimicrobiales bacterium]HJM28107.1 DivIVA domain-containing protein [Acidimicrobiales bacterium]HJM96732.1 DivIVA domain-containing protein [Acidimicrobiales bacterium]